MAVKRRLNARLFLAASSAVAAISNVAGATTYTWTGAGTGTTAANFQNPANWNSAPTFTSYNDYVFNNATNTSVNMGSNLPTPGAVSSQYNSLTFNAGAGAFVFANPLNPQPFQFNQSTTNNVTVNAGVTSDITFGNSTNPIFGEGVANTGTENVVFTNNSTTNNLIINGGIYSYQNNGGSPVTNFTFTGAGNSILGADSSITMGYVSGTLAGQYGTATLIKTGSGTLTIDSFTNTYNGGTVVSGGVLALNAASAIPDNSNLTIGNATVSLVYSGLNALHSPTSGTVTINSGGTLSADATSGGNVSTLYNVVLNGGSLAASQPANSTGSYANFGVVGSIHATANSTISAALGTFAASSSTPLPFIVDSGVILTDSGTTTASYFGKTYSLSVTGGGTLILSGSNAYSGGTVISAGTLQIGNGGTSGSLSTSTSGAITDNGTLAFNRTDNIAQGTIFSSSAITGTGGLTQSGTGILTLSSANSYSGSTTVNAGEIRLTPTGVLSNSSVYINGNAATTTSNAIGAVSGDGYGTSALPSSVLFIDDNNNSTSQTNHFGANTVTLNGGTLYFRLDGNGTYGGTVVANLKLTGGGFIGASGQNASLDDQIAALTSVTTTSTATVTFGSFYLYLGHSNEVVIGSLNGVSVTTSSNTNNIIGGWATATNNSSGTTPPDGNTDFASFSTTVAGEVVQLGQTNAPAYDATAIASHTSTQNINETSTETLSTPVGVNALAYNGGGITDNTALTLTSGGLIIGGTNRTLAGTGTLTAGSGGSYNLYTTVNDPNTYSIAAQITDNSSNPVMFVKAGVGSLSLSNTNTYTGGTQINGGTLRANSSTTSLGTGAVSVNAGGTLGGGGTVGNTGGTLLTVNSGGTIAAGPDAVTTGTLTSGSQVWDAGAGYAWKIASLSPTSTTNAARGTGGSGTTGTSSSWDDVAMSALTLSSLRGSNPSFTLRVSDTSTLALAANGTYSWIIGQSAAAATAPAGYNIYVNGTTTNSNLLAAGSSGGNAAFALDTSAFSVSGATSPIASAFTLELVSNGASGDNLVLDYSNAPEPCTGILFLAGAGPLLMARRRRTTTCPNAQDQRSGKD